MSEIESLHKNISLSSFKIRKKVDKKLSRFFNGAHPWSPKLQQARDRVELWTRYRCKKNNVATSLTIIKRLSKKLGEYSGHYISKKQVVANLKKAKKARNKIKKEAYKLRLKFKDHLKERKAKDCKVSVKIFDKQQAREKKPKN